MRSKLRAPEITRLNHSLSCQALTIGNLGYVSYALSHDIDIQNKYHHQEPDWSLTVDEDNVPSLPILEGIEGIL